MQGFKSSALIAIIAVFSISLVNLAVAGPVAPGGAGGSTGYSTGGKTKGWEYKAGKCPRFISVTRPPQQKSFRGYNFSCRDATKHYKCTNGWERFAQAKNVNQTCRKKAVVINIK
jgi:hypothetical protein